MNACIDLGEPKTQYFSLKEREQVKQAKMPLSHSHYSRWQSTLGKQPRKL